MRIAMIKLMVIMVQERIVEIIKLMGVSGKYRPLAGIELYLVNLCILVAILC